jgi:hypothetical protein
MVLRDVGIWYKMGLFATVFYLQKRGLITWAGKNCSVRWTFVMSLLNIDLLGHIQICAHKRYIA